MRLSETDEAELLNSYEPHKCPYTLDCESQQKKEKKSQMKRDKILEVNRKRKKPLFAQGWWKTSFSVTESIISL